jgi:dTDP-glucose 4,6-dehydratase
MIMKILVYGSKGWIGHQVISYLDTQNINYIQGKVRVDNIEELEKEINEVSPTHILSLIGRTHGKIGDKIIGTIDYLEEEGKLVENVRDNLFSPLILALICNEKNIHFTYLGTGCIFDYDNDHPINSDSGFKETDIPNFFGSSYSIVKGFTDRIMRKIDILNLRIRMPINSEDNSRNFIKKITTYDKICSIPNSMSVLPELIPYAIEMMSRNIKGTFNLTNPGVISHNEILELYKEIVDPLFTWKNFSIDEQNKILSSKRSNNLLNTDKLKNLFPELKDIKESVIECLYKYPKLQYDFSNSEDTYVLITGGCGFIGSHFINYIFNTYDKINIINIDAMYYCANETNVHSKIRESNRYKFFCKNLIDIDLEFLVTNKINYIIHFAAQSHVQNSFEDSIQYTYDNVLGTHILLEAVRKYNKIIKFIHVSTDEVYGESTLSEDKKTELTLLHPTNPYAGTKAAAELITQTYLHSFNLPIIITRGNNVYGPNQYPEKVIPKFIHLLKNNKKVTIQGTGEALRSFLHVQDTVTAFEIVLLKGKIGEIYNIGCDDNMEYSILEVAKLLINKIKNTTNYDEWIEYVEDRPFNDIRYFISNDKLKSLGWKIDINFIEGINKLLNEV